MANCRRRRSRDCRNRQRLDVSRKETTTPLPANRHAGYLLITTSFCSVSVVFAVIRLLLPFTDLLFLWLSSSNVPTSPPIPSPTPAAPTIKQQLLQLPSNSATPYPEQITRDKCAPCLYKLFLLGNLNPDRYLCRCFILIVTPVAIPTPPGPRES